MNDAYCTRFLYRKPSFILRGMRHLSKYTERCNDIISGSHAFLFRLVIFSVFLLHIKTHTITHQTNKVNNNTIFCRVFTVFFKINMAFPIRILLVEPEMHSILFLLANGLVLIYALLFVVSSPYILIYLIVHFAVFFGINYFLSPQLAHI
jgi:hypothetical protein